ncbi:MAG: tetratricopeptide repeat protein [candidate division Zixibacteria bacterium]|nr:tetratricopeptide repeat protein [candidate division Zixibacteria bacterium]
MNHCTDKRFKEMRHGYELGLLNEKDRQEFELHMFDCEACFEAIAETHNASRHILQSPEIRSIINDAEQAEEAKVKEKPKPARIWSTLIPVAAIVLLVLILKPWKIEIHPDDTAIASENRLVIACFANLAEVDTANRMGEAVSNLLITDLAESHYLQVVSSQRVYDLLRSMGLPEECQIDPEISTEIAQRANAKWLLTGSIIQDEPEMVIVSQLIDVSTGNTVATQRVSSDSIESIFSLVDKLTIEVKQDLILPQAALDEPDRMVAEVTTNSPEAYAYFLDGVSNNNKLYKADAADAFRAALELDSTIAMAYYYLSELDKSSENIDKAVQYIDNASQKGQHYIRSRAAGYKGEHEEAIAELEALIKRFPDEKQGYMLIGNYYFKQRKTERAIEYYKKTIEIDPLSKLTYNQMAYSYNQIGDFQRSLWAINKYIEIAPNEANPYDSRGEIYAKMGMLDESIDSYRTALQIKPTFYDSWQKLGIMYLFKGEYNKADSCLSVAKNLGSESKIQSWSNLLILACYSRPYKLNQAMKMIDDIIANQKADKSAKSWTHYYSLYKAVILREQGDINAAFELLNAEVNDTTNKGTIFLNGYRIQFALESGRRQIAEEVLQKLESDKIIQKKGKSFLGYAKGCLAFYDKNYDEAIQQFSQTMKITADENRQDYFASGIMLGQTYILADEYDKAIQIYNEILRVYDADRALWSIWDVQAHYYLGLAYQNSNLDEMAIAQYEYFLEVWENAPDDHELITDARIRLSQLRKNP